MLKSCPRCGSTDQPTETVRESGCHFSDLRCARCGRHMGFGKKPHNIITKNTHVTPPPSPNGEVDNDF